MWCAFLCDAGLLASASALFGPQAGRLVSGLFAIGLFASVSALLWAGPRVLGSMGRDVRALRGFSPRHEIPLRPLVFQRLLAIALVLAGDFEFLLTFTQTGLALFLGGRPVRHGPNFRTQNLRKQDIRVSPRGLTFVSSGVDSGGVHNGYAVTSSESELGTVMAQTPN